MDLFINSTSLKNTISDICAPLTIEVIRATYTIIIFFLGLGLNRIHELKKRKHNYYELRNFIYRTIDNLSIPFKKQIAEIKRISEKIALNDNDSTILNQIAGFYFDGIIKNDEIDLFKAFVLAKPNSIFANYNSTDKLSKEFATTMTKVHYFNRTITDSIPTIYKNYYSRVEEFNLEWNKSIIEYGEKQKSLIDRIKYQNPNDLFIQNWILIHNQYISTQTNERSNPFIVWDKLYSKLRILCMEHFTDPIAADIAIPLHQCQLEINKFSQSKIDFSKAFFEIYNNMEKAMEELKLSIANFKTFHHDK